MPRWNLFPLLILLLIIDSFAFSFLFPSRHQVVLTRLKMSSSTPFLQETLFVECGFGNDSHGQNATKAAVRACRNAIEMNSIPSVAKIVPGGYEGLKLSVLLGVPAKYQDGLDLEACAKVFPYGEVKFTIQNGGLVAPSGIAIESLGDANDDMIIICCAVSVGY